MCHYEYAISCSSFKSFACCQPARHKQVSTQGFWCQKLGHNKWKPQFKAQMLREGQRDPSQPSLAQKCEEQGIPRAATDPILNSKTSDQILGLFFKAPQRQIYFLTPQALAQNTRGVTSASRELGQLQS